MLAVGALVMCCASSVSAALAYTITGDKDDEKTGPTGPATPVDPFPTSIPGLSGRYTVASAESSQWKDISGNNNHAPVTRGTITKEGTKYVKGGVGDGLRFPTGVLDSNLNYTIFYVGRYNGATKGRIFDGTDRNWLSTWWSGRVGVAHHNDWMTPWDTSIHGVDEWVQGTDGIGVFRTNGINRVTVSGNTNGTSQITINAGQTNEYSDWAVKEVIIYNRQLTSEEILKVEKYLKDKYMSSGTENYRIRDSETISGFTF